jgi:DNA-binding NarL/FixJ family response regulator
MHSLRVGLLIKSGLTAREREVLVAIAEGFTTRDIAVQLGISQRTVESHRIHLMSKLQIHTVAGLTQFAIAEGFVFLRPPSAAAFKPGAGTKQARH